MKKNMLCPGASRCTNKKDFCCAHAKLHCRNARCKEECLESSIIKEGARPGPCYDACVDDRQCDHPVFVYKGAGPGAVRWCKRCGLKQMCYTSCDDSPWEKYAWLSKSSRKVLYPRLRVIPFLVNKNKSLTNNNNA